MQEEHKAHLTPSCKLIQLQLVAFAGIPVVSFHHLSIALQGLLPPLRGNGLFLLLAKVQKPPVGVLLCFCSSLNLGRGCPEDICNALLILTMPYKSASASTASHPDLSGSEAISGQLLWTSQDELSSYTFAHNLFKISSFLTTLASKIFLLKRKSILQALTQSCSRCKSHHLGREAAQALRRLHLLMITGSRWLEHTAVLPARPVVIVVSYPHIKVSTCRKSSASTEYMRQHPPC